MPDTRIFRLLRASRVRQLVFNPHTKLSPSVRASSRRAAARRYAGAAVAGAGAGPTADRRRAADPGGHPVLDRFDISGRDKPLLLRCRITSLRVGRMEVPSLDAQQGDAAPPAQSQARVPTPTNSHLFQPRLTTIGPSLGSRFPGGAVAPTRGPVRAVVSLRAADSRVRSGCRLSIARTKPLRHRGCRHNYQ